MTALIAAAVYVVGAAGFGVYAATSGLYALAFTSFMLAAAVGACVWAAARPL